MIQAEIWKEFHQNATMNKQIVNTQASQHLCNILAVHATLRHVYYVTKAVQTMEDTHCGW